MLSRGPRRRGFTIIEVLVFSTILLLLTGSITLLVQGGLRYMRTSSAYQDAQRQTLVGMTKVVDTLSKSTPARLGPLPPIVDSDHIIVLSPEEDPPVTDWSYDGEQVQYHAWVCFYLDTTSQDLISARIPLASPSTSNELGAAPPLSDFQALAGTSSHRPVAHRVTEFLINDGPSSRQLTVRLASSVETGTNKFTTVVSRSMVTLPNP